MFREERYQPDRIVSRLLVHDEQCAASGKTSQLQASKLGLAICVVRSADPLA
jgi:hypothetical protein